MKYESEFNVGDSVFCIIDNNITECIVTKITFPEVNLLISSFDDNTIMYYVHKKLADMPESLGYIIQKSRCLHACHIGRTVDELLEKAKKQYKKRYKK